ncbi:SPOR domain-containing protein [Rugamonas sp. FT82W]|uniref:SPOR domain-containing protein n=1 Tax=Duganella vulcania TaxID=2692166 RepID=A0A845G8C1_9BURK|nr:SPOR domain-containing protein [Duganella vulcania]MYM89712.1 SPOR domain-containing protein [Duganella vulcania]
MNFRSSLTPRSRQHGNTIIGIVIGLVIGLAIAVVVALVINKGATPFTDKGRSSKAAEPTAGQAADPNKPMYGNKDAVREAAKDFAKDTPKEPPKAPPPADPLQAVVDKIQGAPAPAAPAPAPVEKPKAAAAAVAVTPGAANVAPTPAKPAADSGDDKFIYYLQAGAFREIADAESARAKLALLGFEANVSDRATDTGVLHRVRLGPFNQVETMNKVRSKLSENGVDVAVVRNQK